MARHIPRRYAASKYAVRGLSFAAAKDLKPLGICVTCLMPDAVQTPMVEMQLHHEESSIAYSAGILTLVRRSRFGLGLKLVGTAG